MYARVPVRINRTLIDSHHDGRSLNNKHEDKQTNQKNLQKTVRLLLAATTLTAQKDERKIVIVKIKLHGLQNTPKNAPRIIF
jgi:hypothetical protein